MPLNDFIAQAVYLIPSVIPHLKSGFYKTYSYMLNVIERSVRAVYNGNLGTSDFVASMQMLIAGQIQQAYWQAWEDDGNTNHPLPSYLQKAMEADISKNVDTVFVYQYYNDILEARIKKSPIAPLLSRAAMWATRYTEAYNYAVLLIIKDTGGKLKWTLGQTEQHCSSCRQLNGVIAYASEWELAGVRPQNAPNESLECGGWQCDCSLEATDQKKSRNAWEVIMKAKKG